MNSVLVIESLNNPNSTKKLYREEIAENCASKGITSKYFSVKNKTELLSLLKNLANNKERLFPLIHFATHGDENGLKLKEDKVLWSELIDPITNLNKAAKNNLVLNMAACYGAFSINLYNADRAPYYFMFGPQKDINEIELENHLANFYKSYINQLNLLEAFKFMKEQNGNTKVPFQVDSCVFMHQRVWKLVLDEIEKGSARHELLNELKLISKGENYDTLKNELLYKEDIIKMYKNNYYEFKDKFFMIDLYPDLAERFFEIPTEFSKKYCNYSAIKIAD